MAAARHCSSWADLQPELLGLVLRQLPSLADRVRLAAVCRPWRHSARLESVPPPFPWLVLRDCTFLSIPDSKIYGLPSVPPDNSHCLGSAGNWLFLKQNMDDESPLLLLMNPFSKDVVQLPDADTIQHHCEQLHGYCGRPILNKLVLLSSMDLSPDSLLAVLFANCGFGSAFFICRTSTASAFRVPDHERICDAALVDGKLYALSVWKLFVLEVESSDKQHEPNKIPSLKCIATDVHNPGIMHKTIAGEKHTCVYWNYLVESGGKLLHVRRLVGCLSVHFHKDPIEHSRRRTLSFEVFEVDLTTSSSPQWRQLNSLGGKALFVGPYSKALQASKIGAQPDCIYFICDYDWKHCSFRHDSGVFNMINGTITPLLPETMVMQAPEGTVKERSADKFYSARPSWFFPC